MNCSECYGAAILFDNRETMEVIKMEPELDKKKYAIDTRKNIYRGFAKRFKKEIKKRMKKSHYGAYLLDISSLYPVPLTKAVIMLGDFEK